MDAPPDATDVGLLGDVVRPHPIKANVDPVSATMMMDEARIEDSFPVDA
jgi:hypothetical protein